MVSGRHPKKVNEHFFDEESKGMYYVLGILFPCYIPIPNSNNGIIIRSSSKDLIQIVKDKMESEHDIISDPRGISSYSIQMTSVPYLRSKLEEMDLVEDKSKRRFPDYIGRHYIRHFARGFSDAQSNVRIEDNRLVYVYIL